MYADTMKMVGLEGAVDNLTMLEPTTVQTSAEVPIHEYSSAEKYSIVIASVGKAFFVFYYIQCNYQKDCSKQLCY